MLIPCFPEAPVQLLTVPRRGHHELGGMWSQTEPFKIFKHKSAITPTSENIRVRCSLCRGAGLVGWEGKRSHTGPFAILTASLRAV